jgi:DNA-binding response OmpR family regulator
MDLRDQQIANLMNEVQRLKDQLAEFRGQKEFWPVNVGLVPLTPMQERVLRILWKRDVVTTVQMHDIIFRHLLDCDRPVRKDITVHVCHLRKKLPPDVIETVWGREGGYRLTSFGRDWIASRLREGERAAA